MRRLNTYPITDNDKEEEMKITEEMLESNGYDEKLLGKRRHPKRKEENEAKISNENNNKKWATFTYFGNEVRAISKHAVRIRRNS
jgi:hypothetical protein